MKIPALGLLSVGLAATVGVYVGGTGDAVVADASDVSHVHGVHTVVSTAIDSASILPTEANTQLLLEAAAHNSEFIRVPAGGGSGSVFVSYPERGDTAPAMVVTNSEGQTDWTLAVAFQASRAGFVAIAPDYLAEGDSDPGVQASAVQRTAASMQAGNGIVANVYITVDRIVARVGSGAPSAFSRDDAGWSSALALVSRQTGNRFEPSAGHDHVAMEWRMQAQAQRGGQSASSIYDWKGPHSDNPGMTEKRDDLPASSMTADRVVATTPRRNEWVDIAVPNSKDRVRTWVVYPAGNQPAGAIVVMHGGSGMTDWVRAIGDQLAKEGFIALVTDMASGLGPNGGNFDSFQFTADKMRATGRLTRDQVFARVKAVRNYAARMPHSNGKTGSIGFCAGGSLSFQLATRIPEHNASVVYYGAAPPDEELAKATAPVIGFYGDNDPRLFATVEPTRQVMARLGKSYEAHTYPNVTHSFVQIQDLANNFQGTAASWPLAIQFFKKHLSGSAPHTR